MALGSCSETRQNDCFVWSCVRLTVFFREVAFATCAHVVSGSSWNEIPWASFYWRRCLRSFIRSLFTEGTKLISNWSWEFKETVQFSNLYHFTSFALTHAFFVKFPFSKCPFLHSYLLDCSKKNQRLCIMRWSFNIQCYFCGWLTRKQLVYANEEKR